MLTALNSPEGRVYEAVKIVASTLEETRMMHFERVDLKQKFTSLKKQREINKY